jgi:hypothetical protein
MYVLAKWSVALLSLCFVGVANAQNVHGILKVVKGDVQIKSAKSGQNVKARIGEKVFPKDVIITGKDARAKVVMVDNNEINVSPESQVEIQHYEFNPNEGKKDVLLNVIYGKVRSKVEQKYDGKTTKFQIKTPSAVAGVRGTDFMMGYSQASHQSNVITFQGRVDFGMPGPGGTIMNPVSVTPGTQASASPGAAPSDPKPVPKEELAKMDNDTKADTPKADGASGERQPSSDKKEDKKDEKKDDGAKSDKQEQKQEAKEEKKEVKQEAREEKKEAKQDAKQEAKQDSKESKQQPKQEGSGSKSGTGSSAATSPGSPGDAKSGDSNKSSGSSASNNPPPPGGTRSPASVTPNPPPSTLPPPMEVGAPTGPAVLPGPPTAPQIIKPPEIPKEVCDATCRSLIQNQNTKLLIRVNN